MDINYIKYTPVISSPSTLFPLNFSSNLQLPGIIAEPPKITVEKEPLEDFIWNFNTSKSSTPTISTNLNLQGWDLNKTLQYLREHAHDKSSHYCARAVRKALEAGGLTGFRVPNAKDAIELHTLESIGFVKIAEAKDNKVSSGYTPQAGDIAISYENGNHAAMYDGAKWISDFNQKNLDVYGNLNNTKSAIYRRIQPETLIASRKFGGVFYKVREVSKYLNN